MFPSSNAGKKIRLPSLPPHMYRLFSGNLIGCVGYSITRVSLIYHLVGDWQPDAPFLDRLFAKGASQFRSDLFIWILLGILSCVCAGELV